MAQQKTYAALIQFGVNPAKDCIVVARLHTPEYTGARLEAMLEAIHYGCSSCRIYLADTLEAHFLGSEDEARKRGDQWIEDNKDILGPHLSRNIVRWDSVKADIAFLEKMDIMAQLYARNADARYFIHMACAKRMPALTKSLKKMGVKYDENGLMEKAVNYRLEEIAGLSVIHSWTAAPEVTAEEVVDDCRFFDRLCSIDLCLPKAYPVSISETKATEKLGIAG